MSAEHWRRLQDSGIEFMQPGEIDKISRIREISQRVIREGPSMPRGKSYARFPKGWALDPGRT
jgi:hypothetical protein